MNEGNRKRFGQYEVLSRDDGSEHVYSQGMHDVTYLAVDTLLDRRVLLRVLRSEFLQNTGARKSFLEGVRALAGIRHSNISPVLGISEGKDDCYCAIEDPSGENLESLVTRLGCMDLRSALLILDQSAKVLRELWQSSRVIAGLSPSVIQVCYEGEDLTVRFTDLHLILTSNGGAGSNAVGSSRAAGDFRSPEEIQRGVVDIRSNIYSLGLIFGEILGGRGGAQTFLSLGSGASGPNLHVFRRLPEKILYLLELMLERDPDRRIQTPYDLRALVEQCEREEIGGAPLMIRPEVMGGSSVTGESVEPDPLPLEFNLMNPPDQKGVYRDAEDKLRGGIVMIHFFGSEASPMEFSTSLSLAEKTLAQPHPNIVRAIRVHSAGRNRFIAYEKVVGGTLLEVMRKRRRLSLPDVLTLIEQAAAAADHALSHDLAGLNFSFSLLRIVRNDGMQDGKNPEWMSLPVTGWPSFTLKVPLYGSTPSIGDEDPSLATGNNRTLLLSVYLREIAETTHELLGGAKPRNMAFNESTYKPLSTLSEQGNIILRRALFGGVGHPFSSAREFVAELEQSAWDKELPSARFPTDRGNQKEEQSNSGVMSGNTMEKTFSERNFPASTFILLLILAALIAGAVYLLQPFWQSLPNGNEVPKSTQVTSPPVVKSPGDSAQGVPLIPSPTPEEIPSRPSAIIPPPTTSPLQSSPPLPMPLGTPMPPASSGLPAESLPATMPVETPVTLPESTPLPDHVLATTDNGSAKRLANPVVTNPAAIPPVTPEASLSPETMNSPAPTHQVPSP